MTGRGQCNRADFTEIPKFPETLEELCMRNSVPGSFFFCTRTSLGMRLAIYSSHFLTILEYTTVLYVKVHTHSLTIVFWACNTRETKKNSTTQGIFLKKYSYCVLHFINNNSQYTCFDITDLIQRTYNTMCGSPEQKSNINPLHISSASLSLTRYSAELPLRVGLIRTM